MTIKRVTLFSLLISSLASAAEIDYSRQVAPILTKYCAGCHNADDLDGELSVTSFEALMKGGESGTSVVPGKADESRLIRVLTGKSKPKMPPKKEPQLSPEQIAQINTILGDIDDEELEDGDYELSPEQIQQLQAIFGGVQEE